VNIALFLLIGTAVLALLLSASRARQFSLEQWSVGHRGFGTMLVFLLLAGEMYTTFTFLGASGWAYGRGAPAFYILAYGAIAYSMSYALLPAIWRRATEWRVLSQAEFFAAAYQSPALGMLVAVVSVSALIPYLVLQLKGLGIIVSETSYGAISAPIAMAGGAVLLALYVVLSGIQGSALNAAIKDVLVLVAVVALGIALPYTHFGGITEMFDRIIAERPDLLILPKRGFSPVWFSSTVALTVLGFFLWPHTFASLFTARSADVFRRNAIFMPLYQLILLFVFFIGLSAVLTVPGLTGSDIDLALLRVTRDSYSPLIVGIVGSAALLTALVPGSVILMATATLIARALRPKARTDTTEALRMARFLVPCIAGVALLFAWRGGDSLVSLLLVAYAVVVQLFPPLMGALVPALRVTTAGAAAGMSTGIVLVVAITLTNTTLGALFPSAPSALTDLNIGIVAVSLNAIVMLLISRLFRRDSASLATAGRAALMLCTAGALVAVGAPSRAAAQQTNTPARALVVRNVHLIDGTGAAPRHDVEVVVRDGKISAIGRGPHVVAAPVDTIDAGGRWVLPGLIDAHTHIATRSAMQRALESGVTTVRSSSTPNFQDVGLRELVRAGVLLGPDMLAAGVFVTPALGETQTADPRLAALGNDVRTPEQLRELVRVNAARGVDVIKTRATERAGLADQDPRKQVYGEAQLRAVVEEAGKYNLRVQVHAHGDEGAYDAVRAGAHTIEHGTYLSDRTLALMKSRGTCLVPTLVTVLDLTQPGGDYDVPALIVRGQHMLPRLRETTRKADSLGIPVITGGDTNYGSDGVIRVAHEVALFTDAGIAPMRAIQGATKTAAECLGIADRTGTIEVGKEADMIIVEQNPLDDIVALQDVLVVVSNGRVALKRIPFGL
jgi:SSS family solute:Na+ symporter